MTLRAHVLTVLIGVILACPGSSPAQSRDRKINEVVRAIGAIDFPVLRKEVLPKLAARQANAELEVVGKRLELGPEWKKGNLYWDRAEVMMQSEFRAAFGKADPQQEAGLRARLSEMPDAQLEEVLRYYRSALLRKAHRQTEAAMASLLLAFAERGADESASQRLQQLRSQMERDDLRADEMRRLRELEESEGMQVLTRGGTFDPVSVFMNPSRLVSPELSEAAMKRIGEVITEFRVAHKVAAPLPPTYDADFIVDVAREKSLKETANAVMRGDEAALARIVDQAKGGDAIAQAELGRLYGIGRGVTRDEKAALQWTRRAADQGFPRALFNLAVTYERGIDTAPDLASATDNYRRAAEKGFARAQLALGMLYRQGKGVPQDFQRAFELIGAAAKQRLPAAELAMAEILDAGIGVTADEAKADEWLRRAMDQGFAPAAEYSHNRQRRKAELMAFMEASPRSARASATAVPQAELNRRLLAAVKNANLGAARALLDAGADLNASDDRPHYGETALHHAARTGNIELAKLLIAKGANVNVAAPSGFVPLHIAAGLNRRAMVEYLISVGANPNAMDHVGTPLHAAVVQGHSAVVSVLISKGADPNARRALDGYTPLHMFWIIDQYFDTHDKAIDALIDGRADINAKSKDGRTPLDGARDRAAVAMIVRGALPSGPDVSFELWKRALETGNAQAMQYVRRRGIPLSVTSKEGDTLLHAVVWDRDRIAGLHYLAIAGRGLDPNKPNLKGHTPLYNAMYACNDSAVLVLLRLGARSNHVGARGITALHAALAERPRHVSDRCKQAIHALIDAGADPRIKNEREETLLHKWSSDSALVRKAVKAGLSADSRDTDGRTPLHALAHYADSALAADNLIAAGANPNVTDNKGSTPLHLLSESAMSDSRLAIVKVLVKNGARVEVRDGEGLTAYETYVKKFGRRDVRGTNDQVFLDLVQSGAR